MLSVLEPATEEVLAQVPRAGAEETDAAVARARAAFPAWAAVAPARPGARCCARSPTRSRRRSEDLAVLEARNAGKPIADARGEIGMVVETFRYYAGAPERPTGKTIPVAGGVDMTFREPLGVVGLITPWNFPLAIACWKIAPALAAGNTVVLKPAELTPLTALRLRSSIALDAGLPEGVLNVVVGPGQRVRPAPGRAPRRRQDRVHRLDRGRPRRSPPARRSTIKRVTLELGGKSANVVFADADLEAAAAAAPLARVRQRGPGLLRALAHPRRALGASTTFLAALEDAVEAHPRRRPAGRGDRRWAR